MIRNSKFIAARIMAIYAVTSIVWIVFSDYLLGSLRLEPVLATNIAIIKGWAFVAITAVMLYKIVLKQTDLLIDAEQLMKKKNIEITAAYEELLAVEDDLKEQFQRLHILHHDLQASQQRNQALIDAIPDAILKFDQCGTLLDYKNGRGIDSIIDMQLEIGQTIESVGPSLISTILMEKIGQALLTGGTQFFEYKTTQLGIVRYQEVRIVPSEINEVIAIVRDVTNRKTMEEKLNYIALHDKITGLYNRVYFEERMQQLTDSEQIPVGVIMCDIDGLKLVNDTFGHQVGDQLIITVGAIITDCVAETDEVARVGGDEFAILLPNKDSLQVKAVYHRIHERVKQFSKNNIELPLGISIGISVRKNPSQSMYEVFKIADDNMYREKLYNRQNARNLIRQSSNQELEVREL